MAPRDRDPRVSGQRSPSQQWDRRGYSIFLHTLVWVRGASFSPRVLHRHILLHRQARGARLWVEAEDEVRPDLDLPRVVCEYEDVFPDVLPGLPP